MQLLLTSISPSIFAVCIYAGIKDVSDNVPLLIDVNKQVIATLRVETAVVVVISYFLLYAYWTLYAHLNEVRCPT